jgi:uncharacterized protein
LDDAERGQADCVTSIINLGEAFYRLVGVNRREQADSLWRMTLRRQLPVSVKEATQRRVRRAAELKSNHPIAYADAFAVATALEFQATLVTGDPGIMPLAGRYDLKVEWLQQPRGSQAPKGHNETRCTGTQRSGRERTEMMGRETA